MSEPIRTREIIGIALAMLPFAAIGMTVWILDYKENPKGVLIGTAIFFAAMACIAVGVYVAFA